MPCISIDALNSQAKTISVCENYCFGKVLSFQIINMMDGVHSLTNNFAVDPAYYLAFVLSTCIPTLFVLFFIFKQTNTINNICAPPRDSVYSSTVAFETNVTQR